MGQPRWLEIANGELGQTEIQGAAHNPRVVEYQKATTLSANDDETPWCASFVSWCLKAAGIFVGRPGGANLGSARALDWANWGRSLDTPTVGCIVVFTRDGGGHVGFYMGETDDGQILVLGGNQGNTVSVAPRSRRRLVGYRWPAEAELPTDVKPLGESGEIKAATTGLGVVGVAGIGQAADIVTKLSDGREFEWWQLAILAGIIIAGFALFAVIRRRVGTKKTQAAGFVK